jgi:hypothetical protein
VPEDHGLQVVGLEQVVYALVGLRVEVAFDVLDGVLEILGDEVLVGQLAQLAVDLGHHVFLGLDDAFVHRGRAVGEGGLQFQHFGFSHSEGVQAHLVYHVFFQLPQLV